MNIQETMRVRRHQWAIPPDLFIAVGGRDVDDDDQLQIHITNKNNKGRVHVEIRSLLYVQTLYCGYEVISTSKLNSKHLRLAR